MGEALLSAEAVWAALSLARSRHCSRKSRFLSADVVERKEAAPDVPVVAEDTRDTASEFLVANVASSRRRSLLAYSSSWGLLRFGG